MLLRIIIFALKIPPSPRLALPSDRGSNSISKVWLLSSEIVAVSVSPVVSDWLFSLGSKLDSIFSKLNQFKVSVNSS